MFVGHEEEVAIYRDSDVKTRERNNIVCCVCTKQSTVEAVKYIVQEYY